MYRFSNERVEEMLKMINSTYIKEKEKVVLKDLFHDDEIKEAEWNDYYKIANKILERHDIMYSKQKDCFYTFNKNWKMIEKAKRDDVQDIIRSDAFEDEMEINNIRIDSIVKEIRYNAEEFPIDKEGNMIGTRYKVYVFNNGTGYWNVDKAEWIFKEGVFDRNDKVRYEDNSVFHYDYTDDASDVTHIYKLFNEWGISPKQMMYILAYALFFKVDFLNLIFYLVGSGSNGKSMVIKMVENLVPTNGRTNLSLSSLTGDKDGSEALESSFVNLSSEIKLSDFDSTFLKRITGGDTVSINPKNKKPFSIIPTAKHFVSSNSMPQLKETTYGDLRRFLIIEFKREFPRVENFYVNRIEPHIPALFRKCVDIAKKIKKEGMYINQDLILNTETVLHEESDLVYNFINEFDIKVDKVITRDSRAIYKKFELWCKFNRTGIYKKRRFLKGLRRHLGDIDVTGSKYALHVDVDYGQFDELKILETADFK